MIEIMGMKEDPWTIAELMEHPEVKFYSVDLGVLLEYLIEKKVIDVIKAETKGTRYIIGFIVYQKTFKKFIFIVDQ